MPLSVQDWVSDAAKLPRRAVAGMLFGLGSAVLGRRAEAKSKRPPSCSPQGSTAPPDDPLKQHDITFDDTQANWDEWGRLIYGWASDPKSTPPQTVGALKKDMKNITGVIILGSDNRTVSWPRYFYDCDDDKPLVLSLPNWQMVRDDGDALTGLPTSGGTHTYPLPVFYDGFFVNQQRKALTQAQLLALGKCRLGEYIINECM
jgi:hypothetical protein